MSDQTELVIPVPGPGDRKVTFLFTWDHEESLWTAKATTESLDDLKDIFREVN